MDGQISGTNEANVNETEVDPWVAAFAALEQKGAEAPAETSDTGDKPGTDSSADTKPADMQELPDKIEAGNGNVSQDNAGGLGNDAGVSGAESANAFGEVSGITEDAVVEYEKKLDEDIRDRAIKEVAAEFIKRGVRSKDGVLGATIEDPDVCKRDSDGVPRFYNPETGREFTGDNPRRQAQEWVDDYNKELSRVFNRTCEQYESKLKDDAAPKLAVMKFAPKYEKLDDIRKGMFDNVVEDYEIKDPDGKVIGYNCDLDKALALVEKQITMIQNYAKAHQQQQPEQTQPAAPALDMKTSSGAVQSGNQPIRSLAEAMELLQDQQLEKVKR